LIYDKKISLTVEILIKEAKEFSVDESKHSEPTLYGVTDGKAVGTYLEHKFRYRLEERYKFNAGSSARGIDFPDLLVDMKVTSIRQPQSSCPYKSPEQKIFGLGYSLLLFVYDKKDDSNKQVSTLNVIHSIFVNHKRTADYQMTRGILDILGKNGNKDDLIAFMNDRNLPVDDIGANKIAEKILKNHPNQGFLTISNALQWRLQYSRVIEYAGLENGIVLVYREPEYE